MGAPKKNQNAAKSAEESLTERIWINVTRTEKAAIVKAAQGQKAAAWARPLLIEQARVKQRPEPVKKAETDQGRIGESQIWLQVTEEEFTILSIAAKPEKLSPWGRKVLLNKIGYNH